MTDHLEVPLVATGDWIDAAWLNQYLRDNFASIFQGLATAGDIPYAVDANTVGALGHVAGGLLYGGASAPAYLAKVTGGLLYGGASAPAYLANVAGGLLYGGVSTPGYLPISNSYRVLMSGGTAPFWSSPILFRQGGDANNWQSGGSTNHTPSDSFEQVGVIDITTNSSGIGSAAITYGSAFAQRPLVTYGIGGNTGGNITCTFSDDSENGLTFHVFKTDLGITTVQINWRAVGTPF